MSLFAHTYGAMKMLTPSPARAPQPRVARALMLRKTRRHRVRYNKRLNSVPTMFTKGIFHNIKL